MRVVGRDGKTRESVIPATGSSRRPGEQAKARRARLGLIRPIRCPTCDTFTDQRRVTLPQTMMLRHVVAPFVRLTRICLTCFTQFRDVR